MSRSVERQRRERGANCVGRREKASQSRRPGMESGGQGVSGTGLACAKVLRLGPAYVRSDLQWQLCSLAETRDGGRGKQGKPGEVAEA